MIARLWQKTMAKRFPKAMFQIGAQHRTHGYQDCRRTPHKPKLIVFHAEDVQEIEIHKRNGQSCPDPNNKVGYKNQRNLAPFKMPFAFVIFLRFREFSSNGSRKRRVPIDPAKVSPYIKYWGGTFCSKKKLMA